MGKDSNDGQNSNEQAFSLLSKSVNYVAVTILILIAVLFSFCTPNTPSEKKETIKTSDTIKEPASSLSEEQIEVYQHGEELFKANCSACHAIKRKLIGPAMAGITIKREKEWLYQWIRNNNELRKSGDADAIAIYEEYNGSPMNLYLQFTNEDIDAILLYIEEKGKL